MNYFSQKYPLCFVSGPQNVRTFNNSTHSVNDGHLDAFSSISLFANNNQLESA